MKLALVGVGKIALDQHVPALAESPDWDLAATVSRSGTVDGVEAFDSMEKMLAARPDILCLAGFMRVLTPAFVARFAGRMLNIHPSLLPKYPGLDTHARALAAGDAEAGCTVHAVTPELDAGPILGQARLRIAPQETPQSLAARVLALEHRLYPAVLLRFCEGDRRPVIF